MSFGGEKEAARLRRYGYPAEDELRAGRLLAEHERGRHYGQPDQDCPVCRYFRRTRRV